MSDESDRTVIRPGGQDAPSTPPPPPSPQDPTVFVAGTQPPKQSARAAAEATVIAPSAAPLSPPPPQRATGSTRPRSGIDVGDVLNQIYEVTRFIARGGMGEVFEGKNVGSDERVAIKVILPHLAEDPAILEMFRKEARVLESVAHPALVRYRLHTREPNLGVFYIVTDFIEGMDAAEALGKIAPSVEDLIRITRRLAEGLGAAHEQGAIHRDISPDNILFERGRLDRARIIDFGIAKDANAGSRTIIGDGFAGKLSYVAPEQLGDFARNVGPWTDVYSLALVILALARGKAADLGGSLVDAIDKRRAGVDTSGAPAQLRPLLDRMLRADPAERPQSMEAVVEALAALSAPIVAEPGKPTKAVKVPKEPKPSTAGTIANAALPARSIRPVVIGGGAITGVALLAGIGMLAFGGSPEIVDAPRKAPTGARVVPAADVAAAITSAVKTAPCSWLDVAQTTSDAGVTLRATGVAGNPTQAEAAIYKAVAAATPVSASDFGSVAPLDPSFCPMLDNLRDIRSDSSTHLAASLRRYTISVLPDAPYTGQRGVRIVLTLSLEGVNSFGLYTIERNGDVNPALDRAHLEQQLAAHARSVERLPGKDRYRLQFDGPVPPGWAGFVLLTGKGGFDPTLPSDATQFRAKAAANGWRSEMVWYEVVDDNKS